MTETDVNEINEENKSDNNEENNNDEKTKENTDQSGGSSCYSEGEVDYDNKSSETNDKNNVRRCTSNTNEMSVRSLEQDTYPTAVDIEGSDVTVKRPIHDFNSTNHVQRPIPPSQPRARTARFKSTVYMNDAPFSDEPIENSFYNYLYYRKLPPVELHRAVLLYSRRATAKALDENRYDDAQAYELVTQELMNCGDSCAVFREKEAKRQQEMKKLQDAQTKLEVIIESFDEKLKQLDNNHRVLINQLLERNAREEDDFEKHWESADNQKQYSKPSAQLILLRRRQEIYSSANRYDMAKVCFKEAEELQRTEAFAARKRYITDMKVAYKTMKERHKRNIEGLNSFKEKEIHNLLTQKQKDTKGLRMLIKRLERSLEPKKDNTIQKPNVLYTPRPIKRPTKNPATQLPLGNINVKQIIRTRV